MMKIFTYFGFVLVAVLGACSARTSHELPIATEQAIDEIEWEDWGPPVAPAYNRTFKVNLSRKYHTLTIDSMRTPGVEVTRKLATADFDRILVLKTRFKIEIGAPLSFDGCIGGQGQSLTFFHKGVKIAEGDLINCGGGQRTNIKGNLDGFVQAIRDLAYGN